jgi:hypothetical protein
MGIPPTGRHIEISGITVSRFPGGRDRRGLVPERRPRDDATTRRHPLGRDVGRGQPPLRPYSPKFRRDPHVAVNAVDPDNAWRLARVRGRMVEVTTEGADWLIDELAKKCLEGVDLRDAY